MRGSNYTPGLTFRSPRLSVLRAEYAASLRDQGLSYPAIATALGLNGKRRRAFQVVQHGRKLRDEALVSRIKGTVSGEMLDAVALTTADMERYLLQATAHLLGLPNTKSTRLDYTKSVLDKLDNLLGPEPEHKPCTYCRIGTICPVHDNYYVHTTYRDADGKAITPTPAPANACRDCGGVGMGGSDTATCNVCLARVTPAQLDEWAETSGWAKTGPGSIGLEATSSGNSYPSWEEVERQYNTPGPQPLDLYGPIREAFEAKARREQAAAQSDHAAVAAQQPVNELDAMLGEMYT